jgi:hypothetical protein
MLPVEQMVGQHDTSDMPIAVTEYQVPTNSLFVIGCMLMDCHMKFKLPETPLGFVMYAAKEFGLSLMGSGAPMIILSANMETNPSLSLPARPRLSPN